MIKTSPDNEPQIPRLGLKSSLGMTALFVKSTLPGTKMAGRP